MTHVLGDGFEDFFIGDGVGVWDANCLCYSKNNLASEKTSAPGHTAPPVAGRVRTLPFLSHTTAVTWRWRGGITNRGGLGGGGGGGGPRRGGGWGGGGEGGGYRDSGPPPPWL